VAALSAHEHDRDIRGIAIPGPEVHLVVRYGTATDGGIDVHALGGRQRVHRKLLRSGQTVVMARLHLGATEAVLGVPAAEVAGRIVALDELWGEAKTGRLLERLAATRSTSEAATIFESAIAERFAMAGGYGAQTRLVLAAADRLTKASVSAVAFDLGVSERHLRRVFRETIGVGPKTFAKLTRFRRAVRAARAESHASWATIAAAAGYYDQAHLISEFRAIAGVTPRALLGELRAARAIG
jgi:AraC-like DNA-binding protein